MRPPIHVLTPGDHFSPRTGSAIPTVVDGLARAARADERAPEHRVLLQRGTYEPRYDSASVLEYDGAQPPGRVGRYVDAALGGISLPRLSAARYYRPLAERLAAEEPTVVFAHNAPVLPALLADSGHHVVLYAHNDVLRSYGRREAVRLAETTSAVIAVSEALAGRLRERLPNDFGDRVHVVRNGVDTSMFSPANGDVDGVVRFIFLGRTIRDKGPDVVLRAAGLLQRSDLEVVIVGSDGFDPKAPLTPYEQELRALAEHTSSPVRFLPFVERPQLPDLLRGADICVVPSVWFEPSTLTVGEAMASGVPVIASRVGGIPEVIGDAGILVEPSDPVALAAEMERLVESPELRHELSRRGRERAERHDWSWSWNRLSEILHSSRPTGEEERAT